MERARPQWGPIGKTSLFLFIFSVVIPQKSLAQEQYAHLLLRPHCVQEAMDGSTPLGPLPDADAFFETGSGRCPSFRIKDPQTMETPLLKVGDILDMDLIINNPTTHAIHRVRAWLAYDPSILQGESIEIDDAFSLVIPGEQDFSPSEGYAKIGVSTEDDKGIRGGTIGVAHVRFRVLSVATASTIISFYDPGSAPTSHSAVITVENGSNRNILTPNPGSLKVVLGSEQSGDTSTEKTGGDKGATSKSAASASSAKSPSPKTVALPMPSPKQTEPGSPSSPSNTHFSLLQVQSLSATTEGSSLYVAWDPLASAELLGYNLYYGTVSGEYIQKKSLDAGTTNTTLRTLPTGKTYYLAIRAVSRTQQESAFSQEVSITVGDPKSSTSPLSANIARRDGTPTKTPLPPGTLPGATGSSSTLALLLIASAGIGTIFAFRRQFIAQARTS